MENTETIELTQNQSDEIVEDVEKQLHEAFPNGDFSKHALEIERICKNTIMDYIEKIVGYRPAEILQDTRNPRILTLVRNNAQLN